MLGVDRLIAVLFAFTAGDVRRQRHFADFVKQCEEFAFIVEFNDTVAVVEDFRDCAGQLFIKKNARAYFHFLTRLDERFPTPVVKPF